MSTEVSRLHVLLCGFEILEKTVSTRDRGGRFILAEPVSAYLLETARGHVLVDAGLNSALVHDPALREEHYTKRGIRPPVILPEHELAHQLAQIGVRPEDVSHVILTHMHLDHAGNLGMFRHARISVQRAEHAYAFSPDHGPAWFERDYDLPDLRWDLVEGDWEAMPGLEVVLTRGHTPGHQSVVVALEETGSVVLVGDAGDLAENFTDEVLPGESVDDEAALASIRRLKQIARERDAELLLGHDPQLIQKVRLAPESYA
ncbi:MBL fold metallo-hydrolase [Sorangium cellulosum]|uniref:MBL fold metallo-hydrolase n=1 Tax=Sorangium cellulosum TaxID=56 RepID=A0A150QQZ2_SORCE|nr:MBL fold metallo-hydrolase [Sorangium cellulosum]